jgi:hypothetical protein
VALSLRKVEPTSKVFLEHRIIDVATDGSKIITAASTGSL